MGIRHTRGDVKNTFTETAVQDGKSRTFQTTKRTGGGGTNTGLYNAYFYYLGEGTFNFSQYAGSSGEVTIFTVFGSNGITASGSSQNSVHPGGQGGGSQAKYRTMPIDGFTAAYGFDVAITNTMTAPYWASTDGNVTVAPVSGQNTGNTYPGPSITSFNTLFPGNYVFSSGSGGGAGTQSGDNYGGRAGSGGAGGLNINQIGGTTIPSDTAAGNGGTGGNASGTPGEWPGRYGATGGQGGQGQYGSGGGGGGSGSELNGNVGGGGAGGFGQGGLTIVYVRNDE